MPFGWKGWVALGAAVLLVVLGLQFGGAVKSWWVKREIRATVVEDVEARRALEAVRRENDRLKGERRELERRMGELRREADRERAEARRLLAQADQIERARREQPRVRTLTEARDALKALGY